MTIEYLEGLSIELMGYCHKDENCNCYTNLNDVSDCPKECSGNCVTHLGLDTAIAWEASIILRGFCVEVSTLNFFSSHAIRSPRKYYYDLGSLRRAILYHQANYSYLSEILTLALGSMEELLFDLDDFWWVTQGKNPQERKALARYIY